MKKRHGVEQIAAKLRQADAELGKGLKVPNVCKQLEISEQTYYRWRIKYGGMNPQIARQLRDDMEEGNSQLKTLIADQALATMLPHPQPVASRGITWARPGELEKS